MTTYLYYINGLRRKCRVRIPTEVSNRRLVNNRPVITVRFILCPEQNFSSSVYGFTPGDTEIERLAITQLAKIAISLSTT